MRSGLAVVLALACAEAGCTYDYHDALTASSSAGAGQASGGAGGAGVGGAGASSATATASATSASGGGGATTSSTATSGGAGAGGESVPCPGAVDPVAPFAKRFGAASEGERASSVAVDPEGRIFVAGTVVDEVDFGDGVTTAGGATDLFVAKLDGAGELCWKIRAGDAGSQQIRDLELGSDGSVVVVGAFSGSANLGGANLTSGGLYDVIVAKFSSDGAHLWSRRYGDALDQIANGVAVDAAGDVVVVGEFDGVLDFGDQELKATDKPAGGSSTDAFVAKLAGADGSTLWAKKWGGSAADGAKQVEVDAAGAALVIGHHADTTIFPAPCVQSTDAGGGNAVVVRMMPDGQCDWRRPLGDANRQIGVTGAIDAAGAVIAGGHFEGSISFWSITSSAAADGFVGKIGAAGGAVWGTRFGGTGADQTESIALGPAGEIFVAGFVRPSAPTFAATPIPIAGGSDAFIARLDATGGVVAVAAFGDAGEQAGSATPGGGGDTLALAVAPSGHLVLAGSLRGVIDLGTGGAPLTSAGGSDVFVGRIAAP